MQVSLTILLTLVWTILPTVLNNFNFSAHKVGFSFKVVIDAGHGGRDGGCMGAPHNEKDIVLPIALELGRLIEENLPDVEVIYTRKKDVFVTLDKRAKLANTKQADLFISIHANSLPAATHIGGSETYVMGLSEAKSNLAVAKRENAAIFLESDYQKTYQGYDPNSNEGHILLSMFQNIHLEKSIQFAQLVEEAIARYAHGKSRGVKQAGFLVLRETNMPSVLIESGYLTNTSDNNYLQDKEGQMEVALAIYEAFRQYKDLQLAEGLIAANPPTKTEPEPLLIKETQYAPVAEKKTIKPSIQENTAPKAIIKESRSINEPAAASVRSAYQYRVQLAASRSPKTDFTGKWDLVKKSIEIKKEGKYYKYLTPSTEVIGEAKKTLKAMHEKGFSGAFLVAYKNGRRVKIIN